MTSATKAVGSAMRGSTTASESRFGFLDDFAVAEAFAAEEAPSMLKGGRLPKVDRNSVSDPITDAVYSHVRAMRTLGHMTASSVQIARALGLSESDVQRALVRLQDRGVKTAAR